MRKRIISSITLLIMFLSIFNIGAINSVEAATVGQAIESKTTGEVNNIVIFLKFKGQEDPYETAGLYPYLKSTFNGADKSLKDYLEYASYNQLHVNSSYYPIDKEGNSYAYESPLDQSYYEPLTSENPNGYSVFNRMERETELLKDAIDNIKDQVPDNLNIDHDNDGYVDSITFVVPAEGEWSSLLWSHENTFYDETKDFNGKNLGAYEVLTLNSLYQGYGVLSHEYLHSLGFPDLYRAGQNEDPIGFFSIMATSYGPLTVYEKEKYGNWVPEIQDIKEDGVYELSPSSTNPEDGTIAYKLSVNNTLNEEFILEYREPSSSKYDEEIWASGLLIYRVKSDVYGNFYGPPDEIEVMNNGDLANATLNGEEGRTSFSNFTLSDGTGDLGINITDVKKENGNIKFGVTLSANDKVLPPTNLRETKNNKDSIELTWDKSTYFADSYSVYRDGVFIGKTELNNFVDNLKDASKNRVYTYTVTSNSKKNGESVPSKPRKVIASGDALTRTFYFKSDKKAFIGYGDNVIQMEDSIFNGYKVAKISEEYNGLVMFGENRNNMSPVILAEGIGDNYIYTLTPNFEGTEFKCGTPIEDPTFKETTVYYKGNFGEAYLNYRLSNGEWVKSNGTLMNEYKEIPEYKIMTIALVDSDTKEVYITDGKGNYENNNGKNYILGEGNYLIKNGKAIKFTGNVSEVKEPVEVPTQEDKKELTKQEERLVSTSSNSAGSPTNTRDNSDCEIWILILVSMVIILVSQKSKLKTKGEIL